MSEKFNRWEGRVGETRGGGYLEDWMRGVELLGFQWGGGEKGARKVNCVPAKAGLARGIGRSTRETGTCWQVSGRKASGKGKGKYRS